MKRVSVRFADKEHEDLANLSKQLERSLNDLIRESVRQYIENQSVEKL
ncbi:MAG: ribbon-helix-helix protein, CopG family [Phormidesmis sp. CAN_BIN44]|nr:ribbon-helix-helix protein, CopG family [Phormidesmis sp. CAN_BIN44]